ncbi:MAG: phosphoesterase [Planctomycetota bacterium]|nr:MAG: phosphoesterase [Planctomycetota bacterium]
MAAVHEEEVLVVPRAVFERAGVFQGFSADTASYLPLLLDPANTCWRPRGSVEEDPSFKQLIPYCVLSSRGDDGVCRFLAYTRGGGQGEARLRSKRSVGIGGHIASTDGEHGDDASYDSGMRRELDEEITIGGGWTARCVGLINDDATPVGSVHLGIVHVIDLERPDVSSREADLVDCVFATLEELLADRDRFETWSQITLDALAAGRLA